MSLEPGNPLRDLAEAVHQRRREFGRFLRSCRLACEFTQQDVADLLAVLTGNPRITRSEVSRYECGKRLPRPTTLRLLAIALNVPLADLVHRQRRVPYGLRFRRAEPRWTAPIAHVLTEWKERHGDLDQLSPVHLEELRCKIHQALAKTRGNQEPGHANSP